MPWSRKSEGYEPAPDSDSLSDEGIHPEKLRQYSPQPIHKRYLAFLLIPAITSVCTVVALFVLASAVSKNPGAVSHPHPAASMAHGDHDIGTGMLGPEHGAGHHGEHAGHADHAEQQNPSALHPAGVHHCGSTAAEARRLGCIFDTVSFSWLTPECYDQGLGVEWAETVKKYDLHFPFYYDPEGKREAPWSEVEKGERALFVPWSHHLWHCGFLWRKMHRAVMSGVPVDSYIGNYGHTKHCTQIMVEENCGHRMEDVNTIMALKFPYCGKGPKQWTEGTNHTGIHIYLDA